MNKCTRIKLMDEAGQPSRRARVLVLTDRLSDQIIASRGKQPVAKLKLKRFQTHQFTPKIQVLEDGALCPPNEFTSSEWQQIGHLIHVIHRIMPRSLSVIKKLPTDLLC